MLGSIAGEQTPLETPALDPEEDPVKSIGTLLLAAITALSLPACEVARRARLPRLSLSSRGAE
jgi:hypothetical protein